MSIFNRLFGGGLNPLKDILSQGATIIDVRTNGEFKSGHVQGAINIPLDQVPHKINKIRKMKSPFVLCCASGIRSANATSLLKRNSVDEVYNGGRWSKVQRLLTAG